MCIFQRICFGDIFNSTDAVSCIWAPEKQHDIKKQKILAEPIQG